MNTYLKWPSIIGWILCWMVMEVGATLTARLDRYQINEGETVQLTIEAAGQISIMPDTQLLTKDFDVMGVASGSRVNIINGRVDSRTTWNISLAPRRNGTLTIPSLTLNGAQTPVLTLQVNEASASLAAGAATPVFIETAVDNHDPYVQGMVLYTVRVFFAVNLANASLSDPQAENALIRSMGEDRNYSEVRNGTTYQVVERQYAISPQTSGELVLAAPILDAQIPENTSRRDSFFDRMLMGTRPVRLRGDPHILTVRPRPDENVSSYWLPAESVELTETWQPQLGQLLVNEPLTRVITIKALGMAGEQLPDLKLPEADGFKIYPDRTQSNTHNLPKNVSGEKTLRVAYIPVQPGKYILPPITLNWWDTKTDQPRVATLPERVIEVNPAETTQHSPAQPTQQLGLNETAPSAATLNSLSDDHLPTLKPGTQTASNANHAVWFWLSFIFAALWFVTLGLWWRNRQKSVNPPENNMRQSNVETASKARKRFLAACHNNDPQLARQSLLQWAAIHWPLSPPAGLEDLALRLDNKEAGDALTALDGALYQSKNKSWDGQELAQAINKLPDQARDTDKQSKLPNLYVRS